MSVLGLLFVALVVIKITGLAAITWFHAAIPLIVAFVILFVHHFMHEYRRS